VCLAGLNNIKQNIILSGVRQALPGIRQTLPGTAQSLMAFFSALFSVS
jgi:hypothetical protein